MRQFKFIFCLLLTVSIAPRASVQPRIPPPMPSVMRWMTENSPNAERFREQLQDASDELKAAREAARGKLEIVAPAQLQKPLPVQNAASEYLELAALWKAKPLDQTVQNAAVQLARGGAISKEENEAIRAFFEGQNEAWKIIERATSKEQCVFQRDWSQGFELTLPEYATMRQAANLLGARQALLLNDKKPLEAVALAPSGFRIAAHAASDPILISYLVGVAIEKIETKQMEGVLQRHGDNEKVVLAVREAIKKKRFGLTLPQVINGESSMAFAMFDKLRNAPPAQWEKTLTLFGGAIVLYPNQRVPNEFTEDEQRFLNGVIDAVEARWLRHSLQEIGFREKLFNGEKPDSPELPATAVNARQSNPVDALLTALYPATTNVIKRELAAQAQADCLLAACDIFLHKVRHGSFPVQLATDQTPPEFRGGHLGLYVTRWPAAPDALTKLPLTYETSQNGFVIFCDALPEGQSAEFSYHFVPID